MKIPKNAHDRDPIAKAVGSPLSRRDFLKDTALSGASAFLLRKIPSAYASTANAGAPDDISPQALLERFRNPSDDYGMVDCWWWEAGRLTKEKLHWQLTELKEKGVAGTWLYPRYIHNEPLRPDPGYWTEGWWDDVRFAFESQQQLGLHSWFSDWTSHHFVQNQLTKEAQTNREFVGHRLVIHEKECSGNAPVEVSIPPNETVLSVAAYKKVRGGLDYSSRIDLQESARDHTLKWNAPAGEWLVAVIATQPYDLDYLNRAVADRWLQLFFDEYARRVPQFVGKILVAYGPDELWLLTGNALYNRSVTEKIRTERGYDVVPYLIALFHDIGPKTDQVRCDYYGTMAATLEQNFYKPFAEWLHRHGMKYVTIATWGREDPLGQTYHYGDFFRYMRWFDVTGNEDPGQESIPERHLIDAKLSSSVAHLYPPKQVAVCAYWGAGWGMTQEENLAWTNGNYAFGINLFNQHGGLYTLMGGWYEWVPPDVDYYQPYWQYFKEFADYVRRLSYIMNHGVHCADVAILYPLTTFHANWIAGKVSGPYLGEKILPAFTPAARDAADTMMSLATTVYNTTVDFDFIDYHSLERSQAERARLNVSDISFRVLMLPPMTTIRIATLQKVRDFYAAGGTVIAVGRLPEASAESGRGDPRVSALVYEVFGVLPANQPTQTIEQTNAEGGRAYFVPDGVRRVPELITERIVPDIYCDEKNLYFTHQKFGQLDIYFVVNTEGEYRNPVVTFTASGGLEMWDPHTGKSEKIYRVRREGERTQVRLTMSPYQGCVLIFNQESKGVESWEDNLTEILNAEATPDGLTVSGLAETGGEKKVTLRQGGIEFIGSVDVSAPPAPVNIESPLFCELQPTMDNRWGDFRYPPSNSFIGAEARNFRYMEEGAEPGKSLGWQSSDCDDSLWPVARYSYGPYWWHIGPFAEGREPSGMEEDARSGKLLLEHSYKVADNLLRWEPYTFSQKFGYFEDTQRAWGGLLGVSENFFVFPNGRLPAASHFLFTSVYAPNEGKYTLYFGGRREMAGYPEEHSAGKFQVPDRRQAWVNGELVLDIRTKRTDEVSQPVHLRAGWNHVLLKMVQQSEGAAQGSDNSSASDAPMENAPTATYAVVRASAPPARDPYVPQVRWFAGGDTLIYDVSPDSKRVGWYRFQTPPGVESIRLGIKAKRVEAWLDGEPASVHGSDLRLTSIKTRPAQVALRVEHAPGAYAGAAFPDPVMFECKKGEIELGDWTPQGLETYSGGVLYSKTVTLSRVHLAAKVVLDLGMVKTCAEVHVNGKQAGVRISRPFRYDVSELVREGENQITIRVVNTLANHMSSYPSKYVYGQGEHLIVENSARTRGEYPRVFTAQTISGLLGPVQLRFLSRVRVNLRATTT